MVDIPGDRTTTRSITVGQTIVDTLEVAGDHDWFRIELNAGQSIRVFLDGLSLQDAYLRIRDADGNLLYEHDDISTSGGNLDSMLAFTATYTGTYYIDVGAWDERYAGDYSLNVSVYTPPPVGTVEQMAEQLVEGYWNGNDHRFNVSPGGQLTVNLTALTPAGQTLARAALQTWTDIIGVTFVEVAVGGQITFDDNEEGAHASAQYSGGITTSARINVSEQWLATYGTSLNGYAFQTYIHEIGHALGLGHAGNYNGEARYPFDATYSNDGWPLTIMSYFDQSENTYYAGQGFDRNIVTTPMMADILAMQRLYGLSTTTRAGDTIYGPSWTTNMGALCIFDSGGNDTIDLSGLAGNHLLDLRPGTFSNVLGEDGNVSIALGVVIENAIGGAGDDVIRGNSANNVLRGGDGNDQITGWEGNDLLLGGPGNDVLSGMDGFDTIDYSDATGAITLFGRMVRSTTGDAAGIGIDDLYGIEHIIGSSFADIFTGFSLDDEWFTGGLGADTLTGAGGNDTFQDTIAGLNGDTITDFSAGDRIIFRDASLATFNISLSGSTLTYTGGTLTLTGVSGTLVASAAAAGGVQLTLQQAPTNDPRSDFNGDGRSDLLLRHTDGTLTDWLGQPNGGFASNHSVAVYGLANSWQVDATGDFNGDGRDDLLLRHTDGTLTDWLGQPNGSFVSNDGALAYGLSNSWQVAGTGDFNGDGRDDLLLRHTDGTLTDWLGQPNGGFASNDAVAVYGLSNSWQVEATGDFNGDGRDDLLLRHTDGTLTDWLGHANGSFASNDGALAYGLSNSWQVAGTGDFNGDGRDDLLLRHTDGTLTDWLGQPNGGFASNDAVAVYGLSNSWLVEMIGDFNGDGRDDLLLRHTDGTITDWLGQANGSFVSNDGALAYGLGNEWQLQPDMITP
ncbi:MAG TPA: FG-GAP-like repeat-containing protein [Sphingomicrobium sp.]|nr:FG-GAP-like repeat-containing protein [Sphingomicrobium sp.]